MTFWVPADPKCHTPRSSSVSAARGGASHQREGGLWISDGPGRNREGWRSRFYGPGQAQAITLKQRWEFLMAQGIGMNAGCGWQWSGP